MQRPDVGAVLPVFWLLFRVAGREQKYRGNAPLRVGKKLVKEAALIGLFETSDAPVLGDIIRMAWYSLFTQRQAINPFDLIR